MIKPLTSLRFFFALMVFTSHLDYFVSGNIFLRDMYEKVFSEGYLGVSFFFILSGFILSLNYKKKLIDRKISFKAFWVARFARIYPLYFITLLLAIPLSFYEGGGSLSWIGQILSNIFLVQSFIPDVKYYYSFNAPSWSISCEFFFYAIFPFIIMYFIRKKYFMGLSLFALLLIPIGIYFSNDNIEQDFFYINPIFRVIDFLAGICLYKIYEKGFFDKLFKTTARSSLMEIFSIVVFLLFLAFRNGIPQGYRYSCYYWVPMIMIITAFSYQKGWLSKLFSARILVLLGEISYGFYLFHHLAIRYFINCNRSFLHIENDYLLIAIIFIGTVVVSFLSFKYLERPLNKYIKKKLELVDHFNPKLQPKVHLS